MRIVMFVLAALFSIAAAGQSTQGTVQSVNRAATHATIVGADGTVYQVNLVAERKAGTNLTHLVPGVPVLFTPGNGRTASNLDLTTPCGGNSCSEGTVCCNASCGICVPPGGHCIQIVCGGINP
jgi:hypothetical protein